MTPNLLAFSGSLRKDSFNTKLVRAAADAARSAGATVNVIDLADFNLPLFNEDLENREGHSPDVKRLKKLFISANGFLISSPEYNSSISGALKNAIDWVSRPSRPGEEPEAPLAGFTGKVAGIMAASPGALGGLRGMVHLRAILSNIAVLVVPEQFALSPAGSAFDDGGKLKDAKHQQQIDKITQRVVAVASKINA